MSKNYVVKYVHASYFLTKQVYTGPVLGAVTENDLTANGAVQQRFSNWRLNHPAKHGWYAEAWIGFDDVDDTPTIETEMHVWTCSGFPGFNPVGTAAVIVAPTKERAATLLNNSLRALGLPSIVKPENMQLLQTTVEITVILCDGDY